MNPLTMIEPKWELETPDANTAVLRIAPLERTLGHTLGNALRRVILECTPGAAPIYARIEGAPHELMILDGVVEDVLQICQNLKALRVIVHGEGEHVLRLLAEGEGEVKAAQFTCPADVEIANPDLHIATLAEGGRLAMEVYVQRGRGYSPATSKPDRGFGFIPLDSIYSPIREVRYEVNDSRVGQDLSYEELVLYVTTDGILPARQAIASAARTLRVFFHRTEEEVGEASAASGDDLFAGSADENANGERSWADIDISYLNLDVRPFNALRKAGINTIGQLLELRISDIMKIRSIGEKSLEDIKQRLAEHGLQLKP